MGHFVVGFVLVPLLIVVGVVFLLARLFSGAFTRRQSEDQVDETRMIQEIYHKLEAMEDRVDVLETLLHEGPAQGKGADDA